jgi:hypothetical protein
MHHLKFPRFATFCVCDKKANVEGIRPRADLLPIHNSKLDPGKTVAAGASRAMAIGIFDRRLESFESMLCNSF